MGDFIGILNVITINIYFDIRNSTIKKMPPKKRNPEVGLEVGQLGFMVDRSILTWAKRPLYSARGTM